MIFRSDLEVELVNNWGSDEMVARAARVSTGKDQLDNRKIEGLIRYLVKNGHTSPLEHAGATFRLEVPLFVRDQIVRHRTFSYNIKSLRFSEAVPEFYVPGEGRPMYNAGSGAHPELVPDHPDGRPLWESVGEEFRYNAKSSWGSYTNLLSYGVAEEVARGVLPTNLYTSMYMTGNLWAWMQFLDKRIGSDQNRPQWEIEAVALQVQDHLIEMFPVTMGKRKEDT